MYNSSAKRIRQAPEINSGEVLVETAGYISRERKIKSMIAAGVRLDNLRKMGAFDIPADTPYEKIDTDKYQIDQTRNKGFDMAEASMILMDLKRRVSEMQKLIKEKPKAALQKVEDDLKNIDDVGELGLESPQTAQDEPGTVLEQGQAPKGVRKK